MIWTVVVEDPSALIERTERTTWTSQGLAWRYATSELATMWRRRGASIKMLHGDTEVWHWDGWRDIRTVTSNQRRSAI